MYSQRSKPVIGLTGGIGSGKTLVAEAFQSFGAAVIDSDRLAHGLLNTADVIDTLRSWWGGRIIAPDGSVDRRAIATIVFDNPVELSRLESLLYPRIDERRRALMAEFEADPSILAVVWDAPKLCEAGLDEQCDAVVFVETDRAERLRRLVESRDWNDAELTRREKLQKPLDKKKTDADYVVINHSGIENIRSQVKRVFAEVLASFT